MIVFLRSAQQACRPAALTARKLYNSEEEKVMEKKIESLIKEHKIIAIFKRCAVREDR